LNVFEFKLILNSDELKEVQHLRQSFESKYQTKSGPKLYDSNSSIASDGLTPRQGRHVYSTQHPPKIPQAPLGAQCEDDLHCAPKGAC